MYVCKCIKSIKIKIFKFKRQMNVKYDYYFIFETRQMYVKWSEVLGTLFMH
jgi:hypothetical protein